MLLLKKLDYIVQLVVFITCVLLIIATTFLSFKMLDDPFKLYYIVGTTQSVSALFWYLFEGGNASKMRKMYNLIVIIYVCFSLFFITLFQSLFFAFLALAITPFLAIFYCIICYFDLKILEVKDC